MIVSCFATGGVCDGFPCSRCGRGMPMNTERISKRLAFIGVTLEGYAEENMPSWYTEKVWKEYSDDLENLLTTIRSCATIRDVRAAIKEFDNTTPKGFK